MFTHKIKFKLVHKLVIYFFPIFNIKMLNFVLCQVSTFRYHLAYNISLLRNQDVSGKESLSLKGEPLKWDLFFSKDFQSSVSATYSCREYAMIYKGPDFLTVVWIGSSPTPFTLSRQQVVSLFLSRPVCRWSSLPTEGDGRGAKSYDHKKACMALCKSFNTLCTVV